MAPCWRSDFEFRVGLQSLKEGCSMDFRDLLESCQCSCGGCKVTG